MSAFRVATIPPAHVVARSAILVAYDFPMSRFPQGRERKAFSRAFICPSGEYATFGKAAKAGKKGSRAPVTMHDKITFAVTSRCKYAYGVGGRMD
jgi:hypothetical protein